MVNGAVTFPKRIIEEVKRGVCKRTESQVLELFLRSVFLTRELNSTLLKVCR